MSAKNIHIKLEYPETISMKKDMLLLEKDFLEIMKYAKNFEELKKKEFLVKSKLKKDLALLESAISSAESHLPMEEIEVKQEKHEKNQAMHTLKTGKTFEKKKSDVERQIDEIREKLARLG